MQSKRIISLVLAVVLACTAATVLVFAVFYVMVFAVTAREYYKIVNE